MNIFKNIPNPLTWFMLLLLSAFVAGCSDGVTAISATATTTAQSLTVGTAMVSFSPLTASGGATPYTYSITSGTLPAGLSLSASTGAVTGTPTAVYATANVVFSVKDANNVVANTSSTVSFTVGAASVSISATATTTAQSLTVGTAMTSFSPLAASGGAIPYTFSVTGSTLLPAGLSLDASTGAVSGTPTATYATANVVFSVKDAGNVVANTTSTVSFTVVAAPVSISAIATTTAQNLTVGSAMPSFSPLAPSGGAAPYTFSVTTGTLPAGLSLNASTGVVTGIPTAVYATANVVFSVKDDGNVVANTTSTVSFTVGAAATTVLPGAGANPTVISASPGNLATNVPISSKGVGNAVTGKQLIATFNEPMNSTTVAAFTLKETASGANVPGAVATNGANTAWTFTPTVATLTADTDYTATVTTAAQTFSANTPIRNTVAWSFRTKAGAQTFSQLPIELGKAGTFAIFSNTAVTSVFQSDVSGNVGTAGTGSNTTITCPEVTPLNVSKVFTVDATFADATCNTNDGTFVGLAAGDLSAAITDAKGRTIPDSVDDQTGLVGDISGLTLAPGLYKWNTGVLVSNAGLTLTGGANDVWIFQISGDLTLQDSAIITLGGNAQAKNIFWQVAGGAGANLGVNVALKGVVMADAGIQLNGGLSTPTVVNGRLLANSAVTLIMNTITPPAP